MSHPIVYQWSDGSLVEMSPITQFGEGARLRLVFPGAVSFMISLNPDRAAFASSPSLANLMRQRGVSEEGVIEKYPQIQAQIRGLLLDLGVAPNRAGVLLRGASGDITTPFFVSEDLWRRRFDLAKDQSIGGNSFEAVPDYMGIGNIYRLEIRYDSWKMNWRISWASGESGGEVSTTSDTFENAVGLVMKSNNIRPESARAAWEAEFVERGTFLIPTPEEVEVFRILDEPLPFFLPGDEAGKWVRGRLS
jgi:hypothetical protein